MPIIKDELDGDEALGDLGSGNLEQEVEDYITRNGVDSGAARSLKALNPEMQAEIIKNDMTNCRSPSAVLLSRIERLKSSFSPQAVSPQVAPRRGGPGPPPGPSVFQRIPPTSAPPRTGGPPAGPVLRGSAARSRSPKVVNARVTPISGQNWESREKGWGERDRGWEKGWDKSWDSGARNGPSGQEVEDFIIRHALDERCANQLRALGPAEQHAIVQTDLTNARNPSAVVLSRISRVQNDGHRQAVEDYLARNGVDEVAGQALRMLAPEQQQQIILTDLSNSRNPSAVLLSRIRSMEASLGVPPGQPPPPGAPMAAGAYGQPLWTGPSPQASAMAEEFIQKYNLDEKAPGRCACSFLQIFSSSPQVFFCNLTLRKTYGNHPKTAQNHFLLLAAESFSSPFGLFFPVSRDPRLLFRSLQTRPPPPNRSVDWPPVGASPRWPST